jgi:membrane-associated phospholipid phosphatase
VLDPLAVAVGIGLLGSIFAGPVVAYGLDLLPQERRRRVEWLLIGAAVVFAVIADILEDGPGAGGVSIYILGALPGLLTFVVWRSQLASALVSLAPMYFVIAILTRTRQTYTPELALDRAVSLQPAWMIVYGSLYVFVVILPLLVVRERALIRRAMQAYLMVMIVAYTGFLLYPTSGPIRADVPADGFAAWTLGLVYSIDPPYNCFPSLHVAYAFVSALACYRIHRGVGTVAVLWAALIGVSTLSTRQHYVVDVIAGSAIAFVAYGMFLRRHPRAAIAERDVRLAPFRALIAVAIYGAMVVAFRVAYTAAR